MWWLLACTAAEESPDVPDADCEETSDTLPAPRTVLVVSIDTVNRAFIGHYGEWEVTPRLNALLAEATFFPHAVSTRGLSGPAIASFLTGAYPRTHGVRENDESIDSEGIVDGLRTLGDRFHDAGYRTFGYSANQCYLLDDEMETLCTWADPSITQEEGDTELTSGLIDTFAGLDADEAVFAWLHFMEPHHPYTAREPWFSEFHPEEYGGPFRVDMDGAIEAYEAGTVTYTAADRAWVEATYASQVAATDAHIGEVLDALAESGRLDDTIIVFTVDHGEGLGRRGSYFFHGCSPYMEVLDVPIGIWAPGRVPAQVLDARVPTVDLAPTLVELVGLPWDGPAEGQSLLPEIRGCEEPRRTAYFERGTSTAGVVEDGWSYFYSPSAGFEDCVGYSVDDPYPNAVEELYELDIDPLQLVNRVEMEPGRADELRTRVCDWVNAGTWAGGGDTNPLVVGCR